MARSQRLAPRGCHAIEELAAALERRGLGSGLVPVTESSGELAVLSVSQQLTVWCHGDILWWQEPDGNYDRLMVSDLVEAEERIVCAHEELVAARSADEHSETAVGEDREASGEGGASDGVGFASNGTGQVGARPYGVSLEKDRRGRPYDDDRRP